MRKTGHILCLALLIIMGTSYVAFGAAFDVEKTTPADGSTGMSVDNMGVKVFFNTAVYNPETNEANAQLCTLLDNEGKTIPHKVVFSEKNKDVMLVLADVGKKGATIKGKTKYTLKMDKGMISADGTIMEEGKTVTFQTLDPKASMTVSMVMMGLMVVGMIFFTSREAKKQAQDNATGRKKDEKVNPYKVAKETGKSVEEIVEKENKRKEKAAATAAKKARHKAENKVEIASDSFRVSRPRPVSEVGVKYQSPKAKVKKNSKSTNPKNQTGKQRNKNKK